MNETFYKSMFLGFRGDWEWKGQGMRRVFKISSRWNIQMFNLASIDGESCSVLLILITNISNCIVVGGESKICFCYKKVNFYNSFLIFFKKLILCLALQYLCYLVL